MSDKNAYYAKLKSSIADKKSIIVGLNERLNSDLSNSDKKSLLDEINRLKQEINNIEIQFGK